MKYIKCEKCGANLDPRERCECEDETRVFNTKVLKGELYGTDKTA